MKTTIALSDDNHRRLQGLKDRSGAASLDAVVGLLLDAPQQGALRLHVRCKRAVTEACARHGIRKLVAFGSRAWGVATPRSDLDLVAEFRTPPGLLGLQAAEEELSAAYGVRVDLHTWGGLRPGLRRRVEAEGVALLG